MKTAISLPDDLYESAERLARERGVPRSQIYALALRSYLDQQEGIKIMEQYNAFYAKEKAVIPRGMKKAQAKALLDSTRDDEW